MRLGILLTLAACIPLAILGFLVLDQIENALLSQATSVHREIAGRAVDRVETSLQRVEEHLAGLAARPSLREESPDPDLLGMQLLLRQLPVILDLSLLDKEGTIVGRVSRTEVFTDPTAGSIPDAEVTREILSGTVALGTVSISDLGDQEMSMGVPVWNLRGSNIVGGVIARISVRSLLQGIAEMSFGSTGRVSVVSPSGYLLAHEDLSLVLRQDLATPDPHVQHSLEGENLGEVHRYEDTRGTQVLGLASLVPQTGWLILVQQDEREAFASVNHVRQVFYVLLGVILVISLALSLYSVHRFGRPVSKLVRAAKELGAGNLSYRVRITGRSEIAELAWSMNVMATDLQKVTASRDELEREVKRRELAEESQRVQWGQFTTILDSLPHVLYVTDPTTYDVLFVNKAFENMLGRDTVGERCYKAFYGLDHPCSFCTNEQILKVRKAYTWEHFNPLLSRHFLITDNVIPWTDGRDVRLEVAMDITEYKDWMVERDRLALEHARIIEAMDEALVILDSDHTIVNVNPAFESLSMMSQEVCQGQTWARIAREFLSERDVDAIAQQLALAGTHEEPPHPTVTFHEGEAQERLIVSAPTVLCRPDRPSQVVLMFRDVTRLKRSEVGLRREKEIAESVIESIPGAFYQIDQEGRFVRWNSNLEVVTEYSADELIERGPLGLFSEDDQKRVRDAILEVFQSGASRIEADFVTKSGRQIPHLLTGQRHIIDQQPYLIGVGSDITKLHSILANLQRSNEELEQFAYVASHDLQEPLRMVASYTQLLEKRYGDQLDDKAKGFIAYAVDGASRMQRLINDLLMYSRVQTRGGDFEPTDLTSVLGTVRANLAAAIDDAGALVTNGDLPTVMADEGQLVSVFQNLIGNAVKFRKEGAAPKIHVSAEMGPSEVLVRVRDNGIGIRSDFQDRVFVIFQRLHSRKAYEGTGIGLALCKRIVERHGGSIWFESVEGEGTTFCFTLPRRSPQEDLGGST